MLVNAVTQGSISMLSIASFAMFVALLFNHTFTVDEQSRQHGNIVIHETLTSNTLLVIYY